MVFKSGIRPGLRHSARPVGRCLPLKTVYNSLENSKVPFQTLPTGYHLPVLLRTPNTRPAFTITGTGTSSEHGRRYIIVMTDFEILAINYIIT